MENLRKRTMSGGGGNLPTGAMTDGSGAAALDVLFSSNDGSQLCVIHGQENWPDTGWTPIGIVIVPGSHNRYGDGSCGVMSLVEMDGNHPESGAVVNSGSQIENTLVDTTVDKYGDIVFNWTSSFPNNECFIPYQSSDGEFYLFDYYYGLHTDYIDWPYIAGDWDGYSNYFTTNTNVANTTYDNGGTYPYVSATSGNPACDFNGIRNTASQYVKTRNNSYWFNGVVDEVGSEQIICSARYKTIGTRSFIEVFGDITSDNLNYGTPVSSKDNKCFWYAPALGELSYAPSVWYDFNTTVEAINQKYGNLCTKRVPAGVGRAPLVSSSILAVYDGRWYISWLTMTPYGLLSSTNSSELARAFLRF